MFRHYCKYVIYNVTFYDIRRQTLFHQECLVVHPSEHQVFFTPEILDIVLEIIVTGDNNNVRCCLIQCSFFLEKASRKLKLFNK